MILLPIHGEVEDTCMTSSSSPTGPAASEVAWSPRKIRRIANAGLPRVPLPRVVRDLPPLESLQVSDIVQRHAHRCLLSGKYGAPTAQRVRRRGKQPVCVTELLERIALHPAIAVVEMEVTWQQRRNAGQFMATVYAQYLSVKVIKAREMLRQLWKDAPAGIKVNAAVLADHTQLLPQDAPADGDPHSRMMLPVAGCILTWQTAWGREDDGLAEFFSKKLRIDDLTELCRTCAPLKEAFDDFVAFVSDTVKALGMSFFSCSMVLNSEEAATSKVHLHAFVCLDWRTWGSPQYNKVTIIPPQLQYRGMIPHKHEARVLPRANPMRALQGGLYYHLCPKIGSLFTASNLVQHDRGH